MLGGIHHRRIHMNDISQFYSLANKKIMRKCPNSFKITYEDRVVDKDDVEETSLFIHPFQAEVFTYSKDFLDLKVKSSHHIDFWVVPSQEDVDMILEGGDFDYNPRFSKQRTKEHSVAGNVLPGSYIVFANKSAHLITVNLRSESC